MPHTLVVFPNDVELAKTAAADWLEILKKRKLPGPPYNVAVSGGRIAKNFFSEITRQTGDNLALFKEVHFFWADERCVPPTDPESNYALAAETLLEPLKIPERQIHRLHGEGPESVALHDAINDINTAGEMAKGQPVLDMIFLGMGEDGHVASLFPGEPEEVINSPAVYRAVNAVKPPPRRFTLGYAAIAVAEEIWVIAAGAGKQGALKESIAPNGKTPLARVLRQRNATKILTDIEIA
jgi:6-phosphogluconolactonase